MDTFAWLVIMMAMMSAMTTHHQVTAQKAIMCYFGSWANERPGDGRFDVDNIDPFLCTHLMYGKGDMLIVCLDEGLSQE